MSQGTNICPRCRRPNPLSQVFCSQCGAKLDLSGVRSDDFVQRPGAAIRRIVWVILRGLFQLGLVAVLALMLWPAAPAGARGGSAKKEQAQDSINLLHSAVQNNLKRLVTINESEVNAYLASLGKRRASSERGSYRKKQGVRLPVDVANMNFREDRVTVLVVASMGPFALSYEVTGAPEANGENFSFDVAGARVGHLPLPGPLSGIVAHKVKTVFAPLRDERLLLDRVDRMAVGEGAVKLGVLPRPAP
jgi:hypothetical protein